MGIPDYIAPMTVETPSRDPFLALMDFYAEAGVEAVLDEAPHDRFSEDAAAQAAPPAARRDAQPAAPAIGEPSARERPATQSPSPPPAPRSLPRAAAGAPDEAALAAREQAAHAASLEELERLLASFEGCALRFSAKSLAFSDGNPAAKVMLVGEAPGAEEDRVGKPFMGRSGQLLDRMLAAIGLDRTSVYLGNVVPWRPPGNRTPTPQEIAICRPFIARQIELADPDVLVCLGGPATQTLLGVKDGILRSRGRWLPYETGRRQIRALPTLHPAYLLRQPLQKRLGWRDFRAIRRAIDGRD